LEEGAMNTLRWWWGLFVYTWQKDVEERKERLLNAKKD
jgi:hypothetical protein